MEDGHSQQIAQRSTQINGAAMIVRATVAVVAIGLVAWILGACGQAPGTATVSGTVAYAEPSGPAPGLVVVVEIQEVSADGSTVAVLGEQRIEDPGPVPVDFEVPYDPEKVDDSRTYILQARVEDGSGNLLFASMQSPAVISQGHPTENVKVNLERIGGEAPGGAGTAPDEGMHAEAVVSGTVAYAEPSEPVPGLVLLVEIQEVSANGATVSVLGEQRIEGPGPVPVAFQVPYDPEKVDDSRTYIVHARVEDGSGNLLFASMQSPAVISQGHPTENVKVNLERIGGEAPGGTGTAPDEGMHAEAVVSGTVTYAEPSEPVPGLVLLVEIQEVSADGATVSVLGEERIEGPGPVPVAFQVLYDPLKIDDNRTYIVHARVEDGSGNLLFASMQSPAVISQGHPVEGVQVKLERIGGN